MAKVELNSNTSELNISVVADKKKWRKEQETAFKEMAADLEIKGFRKGGVPLDLARKQISEKAILEHALTHVISNLSKEAGKEIPTDTMVLDGPSYSVDKISPAEFEVTFIYPVYPVMEIKNYKKLGVKYEQPKYDDKVVEEEITRLQKMQATLESKDGAIAKGDTAVFDYSGSVDGVKFDGGTSEKYSLEIGSGQFIPGFEDQMVGMKAGDEKDLNITFPAEYQSEELKGKDAVFAVKIHEVKSMNMPELNDEFAAATGVKDIKTMDELRKYIGRIFKEQTDQQARSEFQKIAFKKILEETVIVVPAQLIVKEMGNLEKEFEEQMKQQGLSMEQYIKMTGVNPESLNSQFKKQAEDRLKESLIFAELAKLENIEITPPDYEKEYKKLAVVYGKSEDAVKAMITTQQMQIPMTNDRVIDALINYNK